jgi:hypothetical protein
MNTQSRKEPPMLQPNRVVFLLALLAMIAIGSALPAAQPDLPTLLKDTGVEAGGSRARSTRSTRSRSRRQPRPANRQRRKR